MVRTILRIGTVGAPIPEDELDSYVERLSDPERAEAASALYRYYHRAFAGILRGRPQFGHLEVPTLLLFGKRDRGISHRLVDGGFEEHADDMRLEWIPDAGHFIVDEKPDLVSERALEFFGA